MTFVDTESSTAGTTFDSPAGLPGTVVATPPRGLILTLDNYREEAMTVLNNLFLKYPF